MEKLFKKIGKYEIILSISAIIYCIYFITATFLKYDNYYMGRYDLGNMIQTVWNTYHGHFFQMTNPDGIETLSRLAFHADFILVLLTPFYALWQDPKVLLLIQTLVIALGGIFVYLISNEILKNEKISLVFSFLYFLNPAVNYVNLFDFHGVALSITFLLGAFYFMLRKNYIPMIFLLFLAGISKEEIWLVVSFFGALLFFRKEKVLGLVILLSSLFIFYSLIWHAIPSALGRDHFALRYYSDYGDSPSTIVKGFFISPTITITKLLQPERLDYIKKLFLPLSYFSFLNPITLIFAGPDLGIDLLSSRKELHEIYYQYSSVAIPFIFISAMYAVSLIRKKIPAISIENISVLLISTTLISAYTYGPLPFAKTAQINMLTKPLAEKSVVDSYISKIPKDKKIAATNTLASHLSERKDIYLLPQGLTSADYIMFLASRDTWDGINSPKALLARMKQSSKYTLSFHNGDFYVFVKNPK